MRKSVQLNALWSAATCRRFGFQNSSNALENSPLVQTRSNPKRRQVAALQMARQLRDGFGPDGKIRRRRDVCSSHHKKVGGTCGASHFSGVSLAQSTVWHNPLDL